MRQHPTRRRRVTVRTLVGLAAPALALGLVLTPTAPHAAQAAAADQSTDTAVPTTDAGAPQTVPGLATWTAGSGKLTVTDALRVDSDTASADNAKVLIAGLSEKLGRAVEAGSASAAGDVVLNEDASRVGELGTEGYELTVSDRISVTGATDTGVFYGVQTVIQILSEGNVVPKGSSIDTPEYAERGVGICACQITVSPEVIERAMKEMAYLKLNQLWMETKVESDAYSKANFWGYFTKAQAKELNATAKKYHITLVPEVNSPGHMTPWLKNYPDLQLVDKNGNRDADRLDITQPAAYTMITTLFDEYMQVFDTPYWHMGGDEYMLGSAYANYPQFQQYIDANPDIFPAGSTPTDVVINFMNRIDDYVRSKGKTLRIWNDSILAGTKLSLNKDIIVEHWYSSSGDVSPQQLIDDGNNLENASDALYLVRSSGNDSVNVRSLWNNNWNPRQFYGAGTVTDSATGGKVLGAKVMVWPDNAPADTENQIESALFAPENFVAQATWGSPRPASSYDDFAALTTALGHAPGFDDVDRAPVGDGAFTLSTGGAAISTADGAKATLTAGGDGTPLTFAKTADDYYTITSPAGQCLTMTGGSLTLNAPLDQGLAASFADCKASDNLQKWQVRKVSGGFTVENAITLEPLVVADGTLVQQAPDVQAPAVFTFAGTFNASLSLPANIGLGSTVNATLTIANWLPDAVSNVSAHLTLPQGWGADSDTVKIGDVDAAGTQAETVPITVTSYAALADQTVKATEHYTDASGAAQSVDVSASTAVTCSAAAVSPKALVRVDSQEMDYEQTPGTNAIDGNPNTFWGTQWYKANPTYPHEITVDLGEGASTCGISYLPRAGNTNGEISKYEVYVSDSPDSPTSDPVASGTFGSGLGLKSVTFGKAVDGRYLTLRSLGEGGSVTTNTTTVAELTVDPATETPAAVSPTLSLGASSGRPGDEVTVSITGAKPYWQYGLQFHSDPVDLTIPRTDANGDLDATFTVPAAVDAGDHSVVLLDGDDTVTQQAFTVLAADDGSSGDGSGSGDAGSGSGTSGDSATGGGPGSSNAGDTAGLASTGSDLLAPIGGGVLVLLAGAALLLTRLRKRRLQG